jgi:hypothetical protein
MKIKEQEYTAGYQHNRQRMYARGHSVCKLQLLHVLVRQLPIQTLELIIFPPTLQVSQTDHDFNIVTENSVISKHSGQLSPG